MPTWYPLLEKDSQPKDFHHRCLQTSLSPEIGKHDSKDRKPNLRWSETKKLKILIIDNFFFCDLMETKLCTVIEIENTLTKLKLKVL